MAKEIYCNVCGKRMGPTEKYDYVSINQSLAYASKYDGEYIEIDFCPKCLDDLIEKLAIPPFFKD